MKITKRVARITAGALAGVMTLAVGGVVAFAATSAVAAPFDPAQDANWVGTITFYDAAGQVVTSGDGTDPLSTAYMVGSVTPAGALPVSRTQIQLVGPQIAVNPGLWSGPYLNGITIYPLAAPAPASVTSQNLPQGKMLATSTTLAGAALSFTEKPAPLTRVYQVRLRSVGTIGPLYNATTITIDAVTGAWAQIDPPPAPPVTTTTPPVTTTTTTVPPTTTTTTTVPPTTTTTVPPTTTTTVPPTTTTTTTVPPTTTTTTTVPPTTTTTTTVPPTTTTTTTTTVPPTTTTTTTTVPPTTTTTAPAATKPGAPTGVTAIAGNNEATVSWTAGSNGGSAITGYKVTANPGGQTATTTGETHATVTGLTNGTAYTFTVTATNTKGVSVASEASTAVTPSAASSTTTPAATTTTPAPTSTTPGTGVIPVGAPNTGAGGTAGSNDGLMGLGGLALLLGGAGATLVVRRRLQA